MFISRLVRGGLAESTGLLGVNDEILEVNGIDVAGKTLDQVVSSINLLAMCKAMAEVSICLHNGFQFVYLIRYYMRH